MEQTNKQAFHILIVDDSTKNLQVLGNILRKNGYTIEFATNGADALSWVGRKSFDLILLDVMMPEMDGFQVCSEIRKNDALQSCPIIFLTAKIDSDSVKKGFNLGAQDYILKPFDATELLARVKTQIEISQSRKTLSGLNQTLEEKVKIRTQELIEANKELQVLDDIKGEFLTILSQRIRVPLNGILGPLQLLKARSESHELISLINILDASVERLKGFSDSALLLTRINKGDISINHLKFRAKDQIEFSLLKYIDTINKKKIRIETSKLDADLMLYSDNDLTHEILIRAINNALKYTPENGLVEFSGTQSDNTVTIEIRDNGPGFPENFLKKDLFLFHPGEEHVNQNIGINLFLINQIMIYLGGRMIIGNIENGGAFVKLNYSKPIEVE
jgi:two-component system, sensor histidine kinase and response regulator